MRILIVGMADSVHLAKWLRQFKGSSHEFEVVSSSPHRRIHPILKELISQGDQYKIHWFSRLASLPMWLADRLLNDWIRGSFLAMRASKFQPDIVHVLEFQNGGYSYLRARRLARAIRVPLLLTPYGSDIYWFQKLPNHLKRIRELLSYASVISSECKRDEVLASKYGFNGSFAPRIPASGGMKLNRDSALNPQRNRIAIKGYQNQWGQALTALECIEEMSQELSGYEITLFSCNKVTVKASKALAKRTGLTVTAFGKGALKNEEVHKLLSESIALVSLSTSDGVPASMLEAMANGAIPIQSDTSCCEEYLTNGVGGFLVRWDDKEQIKEKLRFVLADSSFRDSAANANFSKLKELVDGERSLSAAFAAYEMLSRKESS
jgi:glycosyltransferase involved in cell wall biosynthesis